jgi:hypothetical protein
MSNKSPKSSKSTKPKLPRPEHKSKKEKSSLIGVLLGVATLIGVPAAVITFWPRVTVSVSDPVDQNQPFSSSVTIQNGLLPLDSVHPTIALGKVQIMRGGVPITAQATTPYKAVFGHNWPSRHMGMDDKTTFALNDLPMEFFNPEPEGLVSAQIAVVVNYELPIVPIEREKRFYLVARKQSNGNFYWYYDSNPN